MDGLISPVSLLYDVRILYPGISNFGTEQIVKLTVDYGVDVYRDLSCVF